MLRKEFLIFINQAIETSLHLLDESSFIHSLRIKGFLINLLSDIPSVCHLYLVGVKTVAFVIGMFKKSAFIMALSILMLPGIENRTLMTRMRLVIFLTFICIPLSELEKLIFHLLILVRCKGFIAWNLLIGFTFFTTGMNVPCFFPSGIIIFRIARRIVFTFNLRPGIMLVDIPSLSVILSLEFLDVGRDITSKVIVTCLEELFHCIFIAFTYHGKQQFLDVTGILIGFIVVFEGLIQLGNLLGLSLEYGTNPAGTFQVAVIGGFSCLRNDASQVLVILSDFLLGDACSKFPQFSQKRLPVLFSELCQIEYLLKVLIENQEPDVLEGAPSISDHHFKLLAKILHIRCGL